MPDATDPLPAVKAGLDVLAGRDPSEGFGERFAREHPEAPQWAKELAVDIGEHEQAVEELKLKRRQKMEKLRVKFSTAVEKLDRKTAAIEQEASRR